MAGRSTGALGIKASKAQPSAIDRKKLTGVKILWLCFFLSKEKYNLTEGFITSFDYSILQVFL